jgi:hypothetical protein
MSNHGGKRVPSDGKSLGAPPKRGIAKLPYSGRATPDVVEFLRSRANASEWIEDAIRRTKEFRDWMRSRE